MGEGVECETSTDTAMVSIILYIRVTIVVVSDNILSPVCIPMHT